MPRETRQISDHSASMQQKLKIAQRRKESRERIVALVQNNPTAPVTRGQLADILKFLGVIDA